jgi:hypothetical protein
MTAEIKVMTGRSDEENFILSGIRMVQRHPKVAAACLAFALSIFGLNNIVELLQRTGLIQIPIKVEKEDSHAAMAHEITNPIGFLVVEQEFSHAVGDTTITLVKYNDGRVGPVSVTCGRGGRVGGGCSPQAGSIAGFDGTVAPENEHADDLSHAKHAVSF